MAVALGHDVVFKLGTSAGSLTTLSGDGGGLVDVDFQVALLEAPFLIEGNTDAEYGVIPIKTRQIVFNIKDTSDSRALVDIENVGDTLFFELGRYGGGTGAEKLTGSGPLSTIGNPRPWRGVSAYAVTLMISGDVTAGTY